jgi:ribonuclease P protein component
MENSKKNTLSKPERLSFKRHVDLLFEKGKSFTAYPLRVVYLQLETPGPVSVLISVSKKKLRRATARNRVKRQVRETYRLNKHELAGAQERKGHHLLVAFLYIEQKMQPFGDMEKAMQKALKTLGSRT